ncbi:hypothetical protein CEUSTIGMA_g144.t1 [Chlamydomonas eustigma]|uniref:Uncharacterized protein n=1 Tax=Chlamydomonas eustigma TaxID=1157962 RepID=A0A250WPD3_9CHLO|nr:hypothetical protein CEUSTIGMA_g144.t1 [Chlamydomonas eustigma]|eukprot:GAX72688.1 hypothetical protein CEUSTIGMA_g144.t1 [Chlamydomonas eustigma]
MRGLGSIRLDSLKLRDGGRNLPTLSALTRSYDNVCTPDSKIIDDELSKHGSIVIKKDSSLPSSACGLPNSSRTACLHSVVSRMGNVTPSVRGSRAEALGTSEASIMNFQNSHSPLSFQSEEGHSKPYLAPLPVNDPLNRLSGMRRNSAHASVDGSISLLQTHVPAVLRGPPQRSHSVQFDHVSRGEAETRTASQSHQDASQPQRFFKPQPPPTPSPGHTCPRHRHLRISLNGQTSTSTAGLESPVGLSLKRTVSEGSSLDCQHHARSVSIQAVPSHPKDVVKALRQNSLRGLRGGALVGREQEERSDSPDVVMQAAGTEEMYCSAASGLSGPSTPQHMIKAPTALFPTLKSRNI